VNRCSAEVALGKVAVRDSDLAGLGESGSARALFNEIVDSSAPRAESNLRTLRTTRGRNWRVRPSLVWAAPCIIVLVLGGSLMLRPGPAAAGIKIEIRSGQYVARVTDPEASRDELTAAFSQMDLDIAVTLVPVSPSLVGTIVSVSEEGEAGNSIRPLLNRERCVTGDGACPVGLRVPLDYSGQAEVVLGRAGFPGEELASVADAFAPGEILHCSDLYGLRVVDALGPLADREADVSFRAAEKTTEGAAGVRMQKDAVLEWFIVSALPSESRGVLLEVSREPAPERPAQYVAAIERGC
jgi:hypothetical protein